MTIQGRWEVGADPLQPHCSGSGSSSGSSSGPENFCLQSQQLTGEEFLLDRVSESFSLLGLL